MQKSLVIVESDAKSKTINRFLGKNFIVRASVGHIKNLPKNRLGVDIENGFVPEYITIRGRGKILKDIKRLAASSERVYLATDPDREGEAIAYHLRNEIESANENIYRVLFYEITESAIQDAIKHAQNLDYSKVEAQKARRVMDRLVGYQVSPFLWKTIFRGLSAGRVQSVTLRLICEREDEICNFVPKEYWTLEAELKTTKNECFRSRLVKLAGENVEIVDEVSAKKHVEILEGLEYVVSNLKLKEVKRNPYPPYTTSTLQQDAARRLGMTTKQTMAVAQQLYEGIDLPDGRVGLITYMRTDSTRLAGSAIEEVRTYIADNYGVKYVPPKARLYKTKKTAQDAHEAVRPTSMRRSPKIVGNYMTSNQKKLYELIWKRFVACQMSSAKIEQTVLEVTAGEYLFRTTGSRILFRGFMQVYDIKRENEENFSIPKSIKKNDIVELIKIDPEQHFTKPPPRYNESSLVKELDNLGIGRPSTYALIISTLLDRKYIEKESRNLRPTDLGMTVKKILAEQFPDIFNVKFTAQMEEKLDKIESGGQKSTKVLEDFYGPFSRAVKQAMEKKEKIREALQEEHGEKCPKCGYNLVVKWGRNGRFIACTGYPDCKYSRPLDNEAEKTTEKCDECGDKMIVKTGRFGRFLACSNYPECKFTKSFAIGVDCPENVCNGQIVERRSKRGKIFFGCSNYPKCSFASWYRPISVRCSSCNHAYMEERKSKEQGIYLYCPKCKAKIQAENNQET
jgi:DNA topoisomerase-1